MIECEALMIILGLWLTSVEQDKLLESVVVEKILEILSRLNFTVDLLVKYKFGRVIKKIIQQKDKASLKNRITCLNIEMATSLFDSWSALANRNDIPNVPRRNSEEDIEKEDVVNGTEAINESESPKNESEPTSTKRTSTIAIGEGIKEEEKKIKCSKTRNRSVKFPELPEELCKVVIFERAPEEYELLSDGSVSRDNYIHADDGEASKAFGNSNDVKYGHNLKLKRWRELDFVEDIPTGRPDGKDSEEKIIQHQRERSVLSINYYFIWDIPASPFEEDVDTVIEDSLPVKTIPIRPNEKIISLSTHQH